ncbi:MAG: hypothetical protein ACOCXA_06935 [Planctomycetota bacterium]
MHPLLRTLCALILATSLTAAEHGLIVVDGSQTLIRTPAIPLDTTIAAWGPKWSWMGWRGDTTAADGVVQGSFEGKYKKAPGPTTMSVRLEQSAPDQLRYRYELASATAQDYTMVAISIDPGKQWQGRVLATDASGATTSKDWPIKKEGLGADVQQVVFEHVDGATATISFDPAITVASDGALRAQIATALEAGETRGLSMTIDLPTAVSLYPTVDDLPDEAGKEHWFVWQPEHDTTGPSVISLADWLAEPAGAHGRVARDGGELVYDGRPFTVWGLNLTYNACAPDKEMADRRADFYAKYGINAVRLHKYADRGVLADGSSTIFDPEQLDKMDYFIAALKQRGIFVKLSPTLGSMQIAQDAFERIPYASDWGERPGNPRKRVKTGSGAAYVSSELQDLHIERMTNLMTHTNPYTGLTYAEDPAIMLVEMINEESALFYGTMKQLQQSPTLRERMGRAFHDWLIARYGSSEAILERWGGPELVGSFKAERLHQESFEEGIIHPVGNPWFWDPVNITTSQAKRAPRLYDTALFLKEVQDALYDRYLKALRATGYQGLFMSSNWQAGSAASHYYNLHSDARFDVVDRHNYFGGKRTSGSMLSVPGGGSLSSGLQQVAGVPFSLSEWIHVFPNQWGAEGPAVIATYGLGLQGWDISFMFQNNDPGGFSPELSPGRWDIWDVTAPQVFGTFPAIARQVRRGDVSTSQEVAALNVHLPSLIRGEIGFQDLTEQIYDVKVFTTDRVPAQALAVVRTEVTWVEEPTPTEAFDLEAHRDESGALVSSTGELRWMPGETSESGWFSIDTPATQAVVGFAGGTTHELGDVTIAPASDYGVIHVTALSQDGTIGTDDRLLILASARAHNTGMKYLDGQLLAKGSGPVLMEPVVTTITLPRTDSAPTVYVCDQDGRRTEETLPVTDGQVTLDGRTTRTIYYEVVY